MAAPNPMAAIESRQLDEAHDGDVNVPFEIDDETFPVPARCSDEVDSTDHHAGGLWAPGKPLIMSYITWNMAQLPPSPQEVADFCVRPNAHIVVVCTQENGPYVGLNTQHLEWEQLIATVCLQGKYERVATKSLWAIHLGVYARGHDVATYVREVHVGTQKTGAVKGTLGNKGGVAVALTVSLRQSTMHRALEALASKGRRVSSSAETVPEDDKAALAGSLVDAYSAGAMHEEDAQQKNEMFSPAENRASPQAPAAAQARSSNEFSQFVASLKTAQVSDGVPAEITLLLIGTHLTAHQHNTEARNRDYHNIIRELPVGTRGVYRSKFLRMLRMTDESAAGWTSGLTRNRKQASSQAADGPSDRVVTTVVTDPGVSQKPLPPEDDEHLLSSTDPPRDVSNEFDVCLFGGDLNYRLNGSWRAIEFIINHRKSLRSVLVHNDQLVANMNQGKVFCGFWEGQLHFRPTYKYALVNGVAQNDYAFSHKNPRMPSYCDRVLIRSRRETEQYFAPRQVLYTDCPEVRTSDHRPVVSLWQIETTLVLDGVAGDDTPAEPIAASSCACFSL